MTLYACTEGQHFKEWKTEAKSDLKAGGREREREEGRFLREERGVGGSQLAVVWWVSSRKAFDAREWGGGNKEKAAQPDVAQVSQILC